MCTSPQGRVSSAHHKWLAGTLCRDPPRQSNRNLWKCVEVHVLQHISSASSRSEVTCANCCWSTCKYKAHENAGASCGYLFADCFWIRTTLLLWAQLSVFFLRPKTGVLQLFFLSSLASTEVVSFPQTYSLQISSQKLRPHVEIPSASAALQQKKHLKAAEVDGQIELPTSRTAWSSLSLELAFSCPSGVDNWGVTSGLSRNNWGNQGCCQLLWYKSQLPWSPLCRLLFLVRVALHPVKRCPSRLVLACSAHKNGWFNRVSPSEPALLSSLALLAACFLRPSSHWQLWNCKDCKSNHFLEGQALLQIIHLFRVIVLSFLDVCVVLHKSRPYTSKRAAKCLIHCPLLNAWWSQSWRLWSLGSRPLQHSCPCWPKHAMRKTRAWHAQDIQRWQKSYGSTLISVKSCWFFFMTS